MIKFENWFDQRHFIVELIYDAIESTIEITIVENPDTSEPRATFVVRGIRKLAIDRFHDSADVTMGDCEKYDVEKGSEAYIHEIRTGDAIVTFESTGLFEEKS